MMKRFFLAVAFFSLCLAGISTTGRTMKEIKVPNY